SPYLEQSGPYSVNLPVVGLLGRGFLNRLLEQQEQLIGQATDQQPQEVGPVPVARQAVGLAHIFDLFYSVFTGFPTLHVHIEVDLTGGLAGQRYDTMPHGEPLPRTLVLGVP